MSRPSAASGFPTALLTFSAMLLVLAIGFVIGRVVVARSYMSAAPKFDSSTNTGSELDDSRDAPGHVYVPQPSVARDNADEPKETKAPPEPSAEEEQRTMTEEPAASAPEPTPPPAQEAPVVTPEPTPAGKTYAIQVGVYSTRDGARKIVDDLSRAGYAGHISPEKRGPQDAYRVVTGRYQSEYAARKALDQLRAEGFEGFLVEK